MSYLPLEMVETVLMRTFMMMYTSDYESDDDRRRYKSGKSSGSERRSFTVLSSVCWFWWRTLTGWPESPTGHWVRHQLRKMIERECAKLIRNPLITQCSVRREWHSIVHYKTSSNCCFVLTQITSVIRQTRQTVK